MHKFRTTADKKFGCQIKEEIELYHNHDLIDRFPYKEELVDTFAYSECELMNSLTLKI